VAAALTNTAWAKIYAAAERKPNAEVEARAMLSKILFEQFPVFRFDRERVARAAVRAKRMLKHLAAFEADYRAQFPSGVWKTDQDYESKRNVAIKTERDLRCLEGLRLRTKDVLLAALALQHANDRRRNEQHAMLCHWLCEMWLDHFEGPELPPAGPLRTPLVNFILAAMRLVVPKRDLPQPDTVRDAIDHQRKGRASLRAQDPRLREQSGG
jgi:hypothetical protein